MNFLIYTDPAGPKDDGQGNDGACPCNWGRTPNLSYLYLLDYLKKTSHNEGFRSAPIQRCDLIHEPLRLKLSGKKDFDLRSDDKTFASDE